jgi:hypothetical protein
MSATDILQAMVSENGHIRVLRGPEDEYISACRANGLAIFAEPIPREMLDGLIKAGFVKKAAPENERGVTIYELRDHSR